LLAEVRSNGLGVPALEIAGLYVCFPRHGPCVVWKRPCLEAVTFKFRDYLG